MKLCFSLLAGAVFALAAIGCNTNEQDAMSTDTTPDTSSDVTVDAEPADGEEEGHTHGEGPHGGTLTDWGGGAYHVEFTVDHDKKQATVYIVGGDGKSPEPISAESINLSIADPEIEVELMADPVESDPEGKSSRFAGVHDNLGIVQEYAGTVSGEVEGTPYTGDFKEEPHDH